MEISNEVKLAIVEQEINMYNQARYQAQIRYRVAKSVGAAPERLAEIEDDLVRIEKSLDELEKIRLELK